MNDSKKEELEKFKDSILPRLNELDRNLAQVRTDIADLRRVLSTGSMSSQNQLYELKRNIDSLKSVIDRTDSIVEDLNTHVENI
jgi:hypothetical protein